MEEQIETPNIGQETQGIVKRVRGVPFKKGNPGGGRPKLTMEQKLLKQAAREAAMRILEGHSVKAAKNIIKLGEKAKSERTKLAANQDVLDRADVGVRNKNPINAIQINFKDGQYQ